MSLGTPWMLLLLPLVGLAAWFTARSRRLQGEAACRLKGVAAVNGRGHLTRGDSLTMAALICVVAALARPQWNPRPYEIERRGRDLVLAVDVSRSMLAADVFPSRLEMARIAILEALPSLAGQRVALITFAGSAAVRVPLTLDHEFVRYMLDRADPSDMDLGSTSLQAAFEKVASTVLTDAEGGRHLVVFTDGEDHLRRLGEDRRVVEPIRCPGTDYRVGRSGSRGATAGFARTTASGCATTMSKSFPGLKKTRLRISPTGVRM